MKHKVIIGTQAYEWDNRVSEEDMIASISSKLLPEKRYIVFRTLVDKSHPNYSLKAIIDPRKSHSFSSEDLFLQLQALNPSINLFLDDDPDIAKVNLSRIPIVDSMSDIQIDTSSLRQFNVDDKGLINELLDEYESKGIFNSSASNLILITGHKDDNLRAFVEYLGKKGRLRNKYVLMFSCYDKEDANFFNHIIQEYGSIGFLYFASDLQVTSVRMIVDQILTNISEGRGLNRPMKHILLEAIESTIQAPGNRLNRSDLERFKKIINQISSVNTKAAINNV